MPKKKLSPLKNRSAYCFRVGGYLVSAGLLLDDANTELRQNKDRERARALVSSAYNQINRLVTNHRIAHPAKAIDAKLEVLRLMGSTNANFLRTLSQVRRDVQSLWRREKDQCYRSKR